MEAIIWAGYLLGAGLIAVVIFLVVGSMSLAAPGILLIYFGVSMGGIDGGLMLLVGLIMTGALIALVINGVKPSRLWTHEKTIILNKY